MIQIQLINGSDRSIQQEDGATRPRKRLKSSKYCGDAAHARKGLQVPLRDVDDEKLFVDRTHKGLQVPLRVGLSVRAGRYVGQTKEPLHRLGTKKIDVHCKSHAEGTPSSTSHCTSRSGLTTTEKRIARKIK